MELEEAVVLLVSFELSLELVMLESDDFFFLFLTKLGMRALRPQ